MAENKKPGEKTLEEVGAVITAYALHRSRSRNSGVLGLLLVAVTTEISVYSSVLHSKPKYAQV